jgi:integrase
VAETVNELNAKLVVGPPKTRASRRKVSLPLGVMEELAVHLRAPGRPTDQVFKVQGGGQLRISNCRRNIRRPAVADANLAGLRIHDRRHTAVALWIAAGANPKEVSVRAGTPPSASRWTATATCSRVTTPSCATAGRHAR